MFQSVIMVQQQLSPCLCTLDKAKEWELTQRSTILPSLPAYGCYPYGHNLFVYCHLPVPSLSWRTSSSGSLSTPAL